MKNLLKENVPLHGTSEQNPGIMDCHVLWAELQKIKSKGAVACSSGLAGSVDADEGGVSCTAVVQATEDASMEGSHFLVDDSAMEDPVETSIADDARRQWDSIHVYKKSGDLIQGLTPMLFPMQKVVFVVDAHTSRAKVCCDYIDIVADIVKACKLENYVLAIPAGKRYDLLAQIHAKLDSKFPKAPSFTITLTAGDSQAPRQRTQYLPVLLQGVGQPQVPAHAPLLKIRARGS